MTDSTDTTTDNTTTSTTYRTINNIDNSAQTAYTGDSTYGTYEDDAITDYGLRSASDTKPYSGSSAVRDSDPSDYSDIAVQDGGGHTAYDPVTGAYDEHYDFRMENATRHHRERVTPTGTYQLREVDKFDDGTARVHREYSNPNTGTNYTRDYQK